MKKTKMNRKKLTIELAAVAAAAVAGFVIFALPRIIEANQPADPEDVYKILYNEVMNYDYTHGRNAGLEKRIENGTKENSTELISSGSTGMENKQLYYNLKAKAEYYIRLGQYRTTMETLKKMQGLAPDGPEMAYIYQRMIDVYTLVGDTENLRKYVNGDFPEENISNDADDASDDTAENADVQSNGICAGCKNNVYEDASN